MIFGDFEELWSEKWRRGCKMVVGDEKIDDFCVIFGDFWLFSEILKS